MSKFLIRETLVRGGSREQVEKEKEDSIVEADEEYGQLGWCKFSDKGVWRVTDDVASGVP